MTVGELLDGLVQDLSRLAGRVDALEGRMAGATQVINAHNEVFASRADPLGATKDWPGDERARIEAEIEARHRAGEAAEARKVKRVVVKVGRHPFYSADGFMGCDVCGLLRDDAAHVPPFDYHAPAASRRCAFVFGSGAPCGFLEAIHPPYDGQVWRVEDRHEFQAPAWRPEKGGSHEDETRRRHSLLGEAGGGPTPPPVSAREVPAECRTAGAATCPTCRRPLGAAE